MIPYSPPSLLREVEIRKCGDFYAVEVNGPWLMGLDTDRAKALIVGGFLVLWPAREPYNFGRKEAIVELILSALEAWAVLEKEKKAELEALWQEVKRLGRR